MSRCGRGRRYDSPPDQPSPSPVFQRGRGGGPGCGGGRGAPAPVASSSTSPSTAETEKSAPPLPSSSKAVKLPPRPGYGQVGRKCIVRANHFLVQVADKDLHRYHVYITPEIRSNKVNRDIIRELCNLYRASHLGNRLAAYDGRKSLYTAGELPFSSEEFVIKLVDTDGEAGTSSSSSRRREQEYMVAINKHASKPDVYHLQQFLRGSQLNNPQETLKALAIVLRGKPSKEYTVVGRSFFDPPLWGTGDLGDGIQCWKGFYQSLRPTQMGLSLNIAVSARAFYESILVPDFVMKYLNLRGPLRPLNEREWLEVTKALKGIKVISDQLKHPKTYRIRGLSTVPLNKVTFTLDDHRTRVSVASYFRDKYNLQLKYTMWPALQVGSTKPVYLPMEVCTIVKGQRYSNKLNGKQVTNLLRATRQRPYESKHSIEKIVEQINFNEDDLVREFGIHVANDMTMVDARVLTPPLLLYHGTGREATENPRMGQWNMINKKMVNGGRVDYWACVNFSSRNQDVHHRFCEDLVNMCSSRGMAFQGRPVIPSRAFPANQIEGVLFDVHQQCTNILGAGRQLQLLIVILPDFSGSYGTIKRVCETELGIVSQCCQPRQAVKGNKQYLENLSLKINVKVGGRNTVLNDAILKRIPYVTDVPTIIFGSDVTHPQSGEDSSPSIAAVVASMDWPEVTKYRGLVSAQQHCEEIIQDLYKHYEDPQKGLVHGGMIRELLLAFFTSTGQKPKRIIFYRDGVGESQFSQVLLYEVDAIRKACQSLEAGYLPPVTFVVVQKRHHTRLFPADHNSRDSTDRSGNILPGTVVDTKICHPTEFDFYLNSHAGVQGTSRPTHYHVLYDENKFTADALQVVTNSLCYTYARCTRSVSIVPPAYYAHLAAFRARYYIEGDIEGDVSDAGEGGAGNAPRVVRPLPVIKNNVQDVMFFV